LRHVKGFIRRVYVSWLLGGVADGGRVGIGWLATCVGRQGQGEAEGDAFAGAVVDDDLAAVALDNVLDDGQAQSGALAWWFGGEEGFEESGHVEGVDAAAIVVQREVDVCVVGLAGDAEGGPSVLGGGLDGVLYKDEEDLFDLVGVGQYRW